MDETTQQEFLRNAMAQLGMSREGFASRLGISVKTLNKWMTPDGGTDYRALPSMAQFYVKDILRWEFNNSCNTPNGGILFKRQTSRKGTGMTMRARLLDAILDGEIGRGLYVERQEVMQHFSDVSEAYTGVLLSNAEMETGTHSPTWAKYTQRMAPGLYRIHPEALANRLLEREKSQKGNKVNINVQAIIGKYGSGKSTYINKLVQDFKDQGKPNYFFVVDPLKLDGIRKWEEPNPLECSVVVFDHAYSESSDIREQILAAAKWCEKHGKGLYITAVLRSDIDFLCQNFTCLITETPIETLLTRAGVEV